MKRNKFIRASFISAVTIICCFASASLADELSPAQMVNEYMKLGERNEALEYIIKKLKETPDSAELLVARGAVFAALRKDELSMRDQNKALEIIEKNPSESTLIYKSNALHNRALLFLRKKKQEEAERDYKAAISADSTNSGSYLELAKLQLKQKRYSEARENLSFARNLSIRHSNDKKVIEVDKLLQEVDKSMSKSTK